MWNSKILGTLLFPTYSPAVFIWNQEYWVRESLSQEKIQFIFVVIVVLNIFNDF